MFPSFSPFHRLGTKIKKNPKKGSFLFMTSWRLHLRIKQWTIKNSDTKKEEEEEEEEEIITILLCVERLWSLFVSHCFVFPVSKHLLVQLHPPGTTLRRIASYLPVIIVFTHTLLSRCGAPYIIELRVERRSIGAGNNKKTKCSKTTLQLLRSVVNCEVMRNY